MLAAAAPRAHAGADRLADYRICDSDERWGLAPAPVFLGGCAGRRSRFGALNRPAAVKQQSQPRLATTPQQPPAASKPPISARDVVIAVDDTDDALQAVEWAAGNVLKGGACAGHSMHLYIAANLRETAC